MYREATTPHLKHSGKSKRWIFPWLLLCICGLWMLGMTYFFGVGMLGYDRLDLKNDAVVAGGRFLTTSGWLARHLFRTFILSVIFGVPALILSVERFSRINAKLRCKSPLLATAFWFQLIPLQSKFSFGVERRNQKVTAVSKTAFKTDKVPLPFAIK